MELKSNWLDRAISALDPVAGLRRAAARGVLARYGQYESGGPANRTTSTKRSTLSGDSLIDQAGITPRERARWLDENHDLAIGILDTLVDNIVGDGISVEPQARDAQGKLHEPLNKRLRELHDDWIKKPEVTWQYDLCGMERMAAMHWLRDGEVLGQHVNGAAKSVAHGTRVPYSIEMIEADYLPLDYNDQSRNIRQGIQRNTWGRPIAFWVHKSHPYDQLNGFRMALEQDLKPVPAESMLFLKLSRRISQGRGMSVFNSVIARLGDLKQYEDFERVAAQVAAALTVFISRNVETDCPSYLAQNQNSAPLRQIAPGMVLEGSPGEEPRVIQSGRPSNQILEYRRTQLSGVSAGSGAGYSSISKDYDGSYSSQRQELVEQNRHYMPMRRYFIARWSLPVYERFVQVAFLSGLLDDVLAGVDLPSIASAQFTGAPMPWVDPEKEMRAIEKELQLHLKSRSQAIRERGANPREVIDQIKQDEAEMPAPKPEAPAAPGAPQPDEQEAEPAQPPPARARRKGLNGHATRSNA